MISAVTEACSVRYAEVDRRIYKFQSLVFKEDFVNNHVQMRKVFTDNRPQQDQEKPRSEKPRGILSSRQSSEWRRAYGEYLHQMKDRKGSDTRLPRCPGALPGTKRAKTEKRVVFLDKDESLEEIQKCEDFNTLMDQPKEDLVAMLVKLKQQLALRNIAHRKNGYCPSEEELKQLKALKMAL